MESTCVIWVIAKDDNGPMFWSEISGWVENPILATFHFHREWCVDALDLVRKENAGAFVERVEVTCKI